MLSEDRAHHGIGPRLVDIGVAVGGRGREQDEVIRAIVRDQLRVNRSIDNAVLRRLPTSSVVVACSGLGVFAPSALKSDPVRKEEPEMLRRGAQFVAETR